jgi:hypothetical protein
VRLPDVSSPLLWRVWTRGARLVWVALMLVISLAWVYAEWGLLAAVITVLAPPLLAVWPLVALGEGASAPLAIGLLMLAATLVLIMLPERTPRARPGGDAAPVHVPS